jgi:hypothetical protein
VPCVDFTVGVRATAAERLGLDLWGQSLFRLSAFCAFVATAVAWVSA